MESVLKPVLTRTEIYIKRKNKIRPLVRELYLRDDIKCHSPICKKCCIEDFQDSQIKDKLLSSDATHYAIPSYEIIQKYLEIVELPEITGIIILQSIALKILQCVGHSSYRKILNLSRDRRKGCTVFLNEICQATATERLRTFSEEEWMAKCVMKVAEFYNAHLSNGMPIYIVTDNMKLYSEYANNENIKIYSFQNYLETHWSHVSDAISLFESITVSMSLLTTEDPSSKQYENYLPPEMLENGIKMGRYFHGILRVNKHISSQEAFVTSSKIVGKDSGDILISGMKDRNRAIHGDDVVIELLPKSEWKSKCTSLVGINGDDKANIDESNSSSRMPTGKVVGVLERKWRDYVATLPTDEESEGSQRTSSERILVVPYDYRIPRIRIATKQAEKLRNHRIIVRIDHWDKSSQYPNGHFVKTLGEIGLLETEIQSLLVEHNVNTSADFPQGLLPELPPCSKESPWTMDKNEINKRRDLRESHFIFSIDPKGCEDVDDTLSIKKLSNGMVELGVHIADVTFFVQSSSLIDLEARNRSTSVYLPDRRYDMLPSVLSGNLCSLLGGVDKYAVSVIWTLDSNIEVHDVWFGRTVIRSNYKLCYEDAQDIINGFSASEMKEKISELQDLTESSLYEKFQELHDALLLLFDVSYALRTKRLSLGGLELDNINMKFEIDKTLPSIITEFKKIEDLEIHKTVAECMIFANHWVAKKISETFPQTAVLRKHPQPREPDLLELKKLAVSKGFKFDIETNRQLAQSLEEAVDPENPAVNQIFRILATRSMNEAMYFCTGCCPPEEQSHYGLGIQQYTHFTSPIRRYPDILVHRLLLASVGEINKETLLQMSELESLCQHMNEKHREAQDVEKCVQELFQIQYFNDLASKTESELCLADGVIYAIKTNGVLLFLPQYGMKGAIYLLDKDNKVAVVQGNVEWLSGHLDISESELTVISPPYVQKYKVFDHITVNVKVLSSRSHQPKIVLELYSNEPYAPAIETSLKSNRSKNSHSRSVTPCSRPITPSIISEISGDNAKTHVEEKNKESLYSLLNRFEKMTLFAAD